MLRSVGAVIGGFFVIALAVIVGTMIAAGLFDGAGDEPTLPYLVANLAVSAAAAVLGGLVVERVAPDRPFLHALGLIAVMILLGGADVLSPSPGRPAGYPAAILVLGAIGVLIGVALPARKRARAA